MKQFFSPLTSVRRVGILLFVSVLIALAALGFVKPFSVAAAQPYGQASGKLVSGSVGITQGQTVRLSVSNTTNKKIAVHMIFFDEKGNPLFECNEIVAGGETYWMDVNGDKVAGEAPDRTEVRAEIQVNSIIGPEISDKLHPVLQVFDNTTGRTTFVYPSHGSSW